MQKWNCTFQEGDSLVYLGMTLQRDRPNRTITMSMPKSMNKIFDKFGADCTPRSQPFSDVQMRASPTSPKLDKDDLKTYASLCMSLLYPARLCRLDIAFHVTYLACYLTTATAHHLHLARILVGYLMHTRDLSLVHGGPEHGNKMNLLISADGSHNLHPDGKGHAMLIVLLNGTPCAWRSNKLPHVTLSSTESELSSAVDAATWAIWIQHLFMEMGHPITYPIPIQQDNASAIAMNNSGNFSFKRSKHLVNREAFLTEYIQRGLLRLVWTPTNEILADIGTKAIHWNQARSLLAKMNYR
jgi:hypothetical protein